VAVLTSIDHTIIAVRNLDQATARYSRLIGRSPSWRGEHPAAGTVNTLFRLENTYIELLAPEGDGPQGRALLSHLETKGEGLIGVAFGTGDADACHRLFEERGLEPGAIASGLGRDVESGAYRKWRRIPLPAASTRGLLLFAIEHLSPDSSLSPGLSIGAETAAISGLDHVVVKTADAEASMALYGDSLGLRLALDRSFPEWGARLIFYRVGGITLEVAAAISTDAGETQDDPPANAEGDQFLGLSYRVRDIDGARERLASFGFDVSDVRDGRKPGTRVLTVRDGTCGVPTLVLQAVEA
jgi:catechol 2,3-dioxygenase-like lactoylglutathione lyase family enzyme